jgi:ATP-dependent DNA helicase RecG
MKITSEFVAGQLKRKDVPEFPPLAIREAVINALIHRDYSRPNGYVEIALYDDRMEILSMGELPNHVNVGLLKRKHNSVPRNKIIADVVYTRGLVEQLGRGTNIIIEEGEAFGTPEPEFLVDNGFFQVTIFSTLGVSINIDDSDLGGKKLTERQKKILRALYKSDAIQTAQIVEILQDQATQRSIQRDLAELEELGLVKQAGSARTTNWRITEKTKKNTTIATKSRQSRQETN